ncbi:MAG: DUF2780 domain-containing protein [Pseudomonadota bacterium]|nr:hypothetical protein [Pseudomonadales bacterium]MDY6920961.1 DUF2780 domain-containing protein [Pseudomonadota bacterium]
MRLLINLITILSVLLLPLTATAQPLLGADDTVLTGSAKSLVDSISAQTGLNSTQSAAGAAALLALAKQHLQADYFADITDNAPGLSQLLAGGAGGIKFGSLYRLTSRDDALAELRSLGLNSQNLNQLAMAVTGFLQQKGVNQRTLDTLKGLWLA